MHEGCDRISVQECVSLCVCVCVCVCLALARALAERRARWKGHLLRQPTHLVSDFCTHINASRRRHLYVWLHQCTPLHGDTAPKRPKGWCGKSKLGANENVRTHYRNESTDNTEARWGACTRLVHARAHTHTHTHTHHSAVSRWSTRTWWELQKSTVCFLSHVEQSHPQLELNINTFFIHRPGFTAAHNSNNRSAH